MNFRQIVLLLLSFFTVLVLSSCSGGGDGGRGEADGGDIGLTTEQMLNSDFESLPNSTQFSAMLPALKSQGITTPQEFADTFSQQNTLEFLLKLQETNSSLQPENIFRMMKTLERDIIIRPYLDDNRITVEAFESLKLIDKSLFHLKSGVLRQFDLEETSPVATSAFIQQQYLAYNKILVAYGKQPLSFDAFRSLRNVIEEVDFFYAEFGQQLQNVENNNSAPSSRYYSSAFKKNPALGETVLNPIAENINVPQIFPTDYLDYLPHNYLGCRDVDKDLSYQIMGQHYVSTDGTLSIEELGTSLPEPLLGDEDGKRYFQLNKVGLAQLLVRNMSNSSQTVVVEHANKTIATFTLDALSVKKIYIPVLENDLCVPYYITKDDTNLNVRIDVFSEPQEIPTVINNTEGRNDKVIEFTANESGSVFPDAIVTSFSLFDIDNGSSKEIYIEKMFDTGDESNIQYLIVTPSNKIYQFIVRGEGKLQIDVENGKWLLFALPVQDSGVLFDEDNKVEQLSVVSLVAARPADEVYKLQMAYSNIQLKKFIVAEIKKAEFSHDGDSAGSNGEVQLKLHTNMAPKIRLEENLQNRFSAKGYPALKCWQENERDIEAFDRGKVCYEFLSSYSSIMSTPMDGHIGHSPSRVQKSTYVDLYPHEEQMKMQRYEESFKQSISDARFELMYDTYASIYNEWKEGVVQINSMTFPSAFRYSIQDSKSIIRTNPNYDPNDSSEPRFFYEVEDFYNPAIPVNMPIFAVTKERLATTSLPLSFEYSATDEDEVDDLAQMWAVAKYMANQALAATTGNYTALVCNTIDTLKELRQNEIDGNDDPLGEANFFLNRFSTNDRFYGLEHGDLNFGISGFAEIPNYYNSYDQALDYASIACSVAGTVSAGYSLYGSVGGLVSGDYYSSLGLDDMKLDALSQLTEGTEEYTAMEEAFNAIKNGTAGPNIMAILKKSIETSAFTSGIDIFNSLSEVNANLGGLGGSGHNIVRSEASYYFSDFEQRKTHANISLKEVTALPVTDVEVVLERVRIITNIESSGSDDAAAEVRLRTRIGVVSDQQPTSFNPLEYDNGAQGYKTANNTPFSDEAITYRNYNGIYDGDYLDLDDGLLLYGRSFPSHNNMAALFIEIGLYEDDEGGVVNDDMIGVLSQTFYLQDVYNTHDDVSVEKLDNHIIRLHFNSVPVYEATHLETSVELIDQERAAKQRAHNRDRLVHPSALISFHVDIKMGSYVNYSPVDIEATALDGDPTHGKESMDMDLYNPYDISHIGGSEGASDLNIHLHEVFNNQVIVSNANVGLKIATINAENQLTWRSEINATVLPIEYAHFFDVDERVFNKKIGEPIAGSYFVDSNHILVFKRTIDTDDTSGELVVFGIGEDNTSISIDATFAFNTDHATNIQVIHNENNTTLDAFVTIVNPTTGSGKIVKYLVTSSSIAKVYEKETVATPMDLLRIDNDTLLLKTAQLKIIYEDGHYKYWRQKENLQLMNIQDNHLLTSDFRTYDHYNKSYDWGSRYFSIFISDKKNMYNVNDTRSNHIVSVQVGDGYSDAEIDKTYVRYLNLGYSHDASTYYFMNKRKSQLGRSVYYENPQWLYYMDGLTGYSSDLNRHTKVKRATEDVFKDDSIRATVRDEVFLDGRYVLGLVNITRKNRSGGDYISCTGLITHTGGGIVNDCQTVEVPLGPEIIPSQRGLGHQLVIFDTQHIYNTPPSVTSVGFDTEHILEYGNSYHQVINFHIDDNESSVDDMDISFKIIEPDTNTTIFEGTNAEQNVLDDPDNFWFASRVECDSSGECFVNVTYLDKGCIGKKHNYELIVKDREITVVKKFSIWQAPTLPNIESASATSYRYDDRFSTVSGVFVSSTAGVNGSNGCVDTFSFDNLPTWLDWTEYYSLTGERKSIQFEGAPPLGTTPGEYDVTVHAINQRGEDVEHFMITVLPPDLVPDSFELHSHYDQNLSQALSETVDVRGIQADTNISIVGGEYSLDSVNWVSSNGLVGNDTTVYIRHTTAAGYASDMSTTLTIGGVSATMMSRTKPDPAIDDTTPDSFSFVDNFSAPLADEMRAQVGISGINRTTPISIIGGEYSLDDAKTWTSDAGSVEGGETLIIRHTSADTYLTTIETMVDVGGVTDTFTTTTKEDNDPDIFTFATQDRVEPNVMHSASVVISGLGSGVNAEVVLTSFARGQGFSVNGEQQTTISNGDTLTLYHVSSSEWETDMVETVVIGDVAVSFTTRTRTEMAQVPNIVGAPQTWADRNSFYDFTPQLAADSPSVDSWSIDNKPDWADFNTTTGRLSGTPTVSQVYTGIVIYATNADGSDSLSFDIRVESNPPWIEGGMHTLDEEEMLFTFTDSATWRDAVTSVTLGGVTLTSGSDYLLSEGSFILYVNGTNNVPTTADMWSISIVATNYNDADISPYIMPGDLDLEEARNSLVLENAPFYVGHRSKIKLHTVDRFGNDLAWANVLFSTVITDNNTTFKEPYKVKDINAEYYQLLETNQTLQSSDTGWMEAYIQVPGCVDVNDGFELSLKRQDGEVIDTYTYVNTSHSCNDVGWNVRYPLYEFYDIKLVDDTLGNIYVSGTTYSDITGQTNSGSSDIYVAKFDRNGVKRWEKLLGGSGYESLEGVIMGSDNKLYLSVTTSGDIEVGSGANSGGNDWALVKINPMDGDVIYTLQGGTSTNDEARGLVQNDNYINLIEDTYNEVDDNDETFMKRFNYDGSFVDSVRLDGRYGISSVNSDSNHSVIVGTGSILNIYDENGTYQKEVRHQSRNLYVNEEDSFFITNTMRHYGPYPDNYYGESVSDDNMMTMIEKRSSQGHYLWSRIVSDGDTKSSSFSTSMNGAVYVAHSDEHDVIQGANIVTITSFYIDILNQYDGSLQGRHVWESDHANDSIMVRDLISNENMHSLYTITQVNPNGYFPQTNQYAGNVVLSKVIVFNPFTDSRSGESRVESYGIVNDYDTNLQWIDSATDIQDGTWEFSSYNCTNIGVDGYGTWRYPTESELLSMVDTSNDPAMKSVFTQRGNDYAYFTSEETGTGDKIGVFFWSGGGSDNFSKTEDRLYSRCVRTME